AFVEPALPVLAALLAARDARLHAAGATTTRGSGGFADRCRRAGACDGARKNFLVAAPVGEELRQVLLEPPSKLVAERDVLRRVREIPRPNTNIRVRFLGEAAFRWTSPSATIKTRCATPCARSSRRKRRAVTCARWPTTSAASPTRCGRSSPSSDGPGCSCPRRTVASVSV